jgi:hypothetical protein
MKTNITLKTLEQATAQEVFDQVAEHMLTQNEQSKHGDTCAYRGDNGLKCAAGCLIGDDEYDEYNCARMEGLKWDQLLFRVSEAISTKHNKLISRLQSIHDGFKCDLWSRELSEVTLCFGLSDKIITEYGQHTN